MKDIVEISRVSQTISARLTKEHSKQRDARAEASASVSHL